MDEMDQNELIYIAYKMWMRRWPHEIDRDIEPYLKIAASPRGWLKRARLASYLTVRQAAKNMGVSPSTYSRFETAELNGNIQIKTLERAAAAIQCELVYAIRPSNRLKFSEIIWRQIYPLALKHPHSKRVFQRPGAIQTTAAMVENDPQFRRQMEWSERHPYPDGPGVYRVIHKWLMERLRAR